MNIVLVTEPGLTQGRRDAGQLENESPPCESHPLSFSLSLAVYISACVPHLIGTKVEQTGETLTDQETGRSGCVS